MAKELILCFYYDNYRLRDRKAKMEKRSSLLLFSFLNPINPINQSI